MKRDLVHDLYIFTSATSGSEFSSNDSIVLNFVTDAVKLWESDPPGTYHPQKPAELSQQYRSCLRHHTPNIYRENRCIACVAAVVPRLLQSTLFTLLHLIGLPVLAGGCSTRSRYDQKKVVPSHRFSELEDCTEAYWGYCRNGGICKMTTDISQRTVPVCSCPTGFRGRQCELINDPNIYFSRQKAEMEAAAMTGLVIAIVFAILFASFVLYLYRRYMKYGLHESNSLSTFETLELSPPKQRKIRNSNRNITDLEKNEMQRNEKEPSVNVHLDEKIDGPSTVFEMFTLKEYPNNEFNRSRNTLSMAKKNRDAPRRTRICAIGTSEI